MGGRSAEHEVSLKSGQAVLKHLDRQKYLPIPVVIGVDGIWRWDDQGSESIALSISDFFSKARIDIAFIMLHGPCGEDGTLQGFFEIVGVPYVGAGVAASAVAMDKALFKKVMLAAEIPVLDYVEIGADEWDKARSRELGVASALGFPLMVKPAALGSSVGITKVDEQRGLRQACETAFRFDRRVLVEKYLKAREIECGVLGGRSDLRALAVSEIIPKKGFYDYEAKYTPGLTEILVPADVPDDIRDKAEKLSLRACQAIGCTGLARVDLFLAEAEVFVNEINTIPGFTETSVYPRMAKASGIDFPELLDRLVELGQRAATEREATLGHKHEYSPGN